MKNYTSYFTLYEDRYRRLKKQGIGDWISNPEEFVRIIKNVKEFLSYAHCNPSETSIIEFGCGQGHLALHLMKLGYKYLGLDISASAIRQARKKAGAKVRHAFLVADVTDIHEIQDGSFDLAIDNQCFHMLITDEHRKKYLAEVRRLLKHDGKAFFHESYRLREFKAKISGLQEFIKATHGDYETLHDYTADIGNKRQMIRLPRVPARSNNEEGYRKELKEAGLGVEYFEHDKTWCIIYARVLRE